MGGRPTGHGSAGCVARGHVGADERGKGRLRAQGGGGPGRRRRRAMAGSGGRIKFFF